MAEKSTWLPDQGPADTSDNKTPNPGTTESSGIGGLISGCGVLILLFLGLAYGLASCMSGDSETSTTTTVTWTPPVSPETEPSGDVPVQASDTTHESSGTLNDAPPAPIQNGSVHVTEDIAYNRCKDYIKKDLKSPSSADFAPRREWVFVPHDGGIGAGAYVDADNSFGAHVRKEFLCTVKPVPGDVTNVAVDAVWTS